MGSSESPIVYEIERIIRLANDIDTLLKRHKIEEAKKELDLLIQLDIAKMYTIQSKFGNVALLKECYILLNDVKQILRTFSSGCLRTSEGKRIGLEEEEEILRKARKMIEDMAIIERKEIIEINEDREKIRLLEEFWRKNIDYRVVYHGTTSAALDKIKRYGLAPGMKIWDSSELNVLLSLMKKAGCNIPIGFWYERQDKKIYFTTHRDTAENYARRSPEFWSQLINPALKHNVPNNLNYENAFRTICAKLEGKWNSRLEDVSKNQLIDHVKQNSILNPKEINLGLSLFYRLWAIFGDAKPLVLHISIKAPGVNKYYGSDNFEKFLVHFSIYLDCYERFPDQKPNYLLIPINRIEEKVNNCFDTELNNKITGTDCSISERIPADYIIRYEALS